MPLTLARDRRPPPAAAAARARRRRRALRRRRPASHRAGFGQLAAFLAFTMWLNIASGAFVRLTDRASAAPTGRAATAGPFRRRRDHAVIEFSNRAGRAAGSAPRPRLRRARRLGDRWPARLALGVAPGDAGPGAARRAHRALRPEPVAGDEPLPGGDRGARRWPPALWAHAWPWPAAPASGARASSRRWRWLAVVAGFALVASGTFSTAAGPHAGGEDIRRVGDWWTVTHWHVVVATIFVVVVFPLLVALATAGVAPARRRAAGVALAVLLPVQAFVGEYQRMHQLPWGVVLAHVSVAAAGCAVACGRLASG